MTEEFHDTQLCEAIDANGDLSSGVDATDADQVSDIDYIERMIRKHKIPRSVHKKQQMEEDVQRQQMFMQANMQQMLPPED